MQFKPAVLQHPPGTQSPSASSRRVPAAVALRHSSSPEATAEIYGYVAARDLSLIEAERSTTRLTLDRAFLANELVRNCLAQARAPYQAQFLSEADAIRERLHCETLQTRIAQLRTRAALASRNPVVA